MRFLANENFPGAAVTVLEAAGHDIVWVRIAALGTTDPDVLAWVAREERILLALDKDFGELARGSALPHTCGVVLLRTPMSRPSDVGQPRPYYSRAQRRVLPVLAAPVRLARRSR
jgi:predicted nuclease of predicted toxin-antitoxin system